MPDLAKFDEATDPSLRELAGAIETRHEAGSPYKPCHSAFFCSRVKNAPWLSHSKYLAARWYKPACCLPLPVAMMQPGTG
jgi:hypothetical protein